MAKRKTQKVAAEEPKTETTASETHAGAMAAEGSSQQTQPDREPGDDTATEKKKSSWKPWADIAVPLDDEARAKGKDYTKGEVARHIEGGNYQGVGVRIDSPDESFRPSDYVKEALKEDHENRDSLRWNKQALHEKGTFHKRVIGRRNDGTERYPVAERLDTESRFAEAVERRKEEKSKDGRDPF